MRARMLVSALATLGQVARGKLWFASLVSPDFFVPGGKLDPAKHPAKVLKNRFRKHLYDAGLRPDGGFLIAGLDANYQDYVGDAHTGWQFHYHAVIDEQMREIFENLRSRPAYRITEWVPRPCVIEPVTSIEGALTYLAKSFWTNRSNTSACAPPSRVRNRSRLAPEQLVEALAWFHGQRFADMIHTYDFDMPGWAKKEGW